MPAALEGIEWPLLGYKHTLGVPKGLFNTLLVLFLGGKNPSNMRWTNKKKGTIGQRL